MKGGFCNIPAHAAAGLPSIVTIGELFSKATRFLSSLRRTSEGGQSGQRFGKALSPVPDPVLIWQGGIPLNTPP